MQFPSRDLDKVHCFKELRRGRGERSWHCSDQGQPIWLISAESNKQSFLCSLTWHELGKGYKIFLDSFSSLLFNFNSQAKHLFSIPYHWSSSYAFLRLPEHWWKKPPNPELKADLASEADSHQSAHLHCCSKDGDAWLPLCANANLFLPWKRCYSPQGTVAQQHLFSE